MIKLTGSHNIALIKSHFSMGYKWKDTDKKTWLFSLPSHPNSLLEKHPKKSNTDRNKNQNKTREEI